MSAINEKTYTIEDIYNLPEGSRSELIDGKIYMMAPPNRLHQEMVLGLARKIADHIEKNHSSCKPFIAPFAVFLNADDKTYVEPDISVICDSKKLTEDGCSGAPEWIIEIVSPGSKRMDYMVKLFKYRSAGVKEYWIADPIVKTVTIYDFANDDVGKYTFHELVKSGIFDGLELDFSEWA